MEAGNAAAHRGWAPTKEQLAVILDTVEGLLHRLLVLPTLAEELKEAVPDRGGNASAKPGKPVVTVKDKIDAAPKDVRATYDELAKKLVALAMTFHCIHRNTTWPFDGTGISLRSKSTIKSASFACI
nr:hypothetical protein [Aliiroseovarius crassostreae]